MAYYPKSQVSTNLYTNGGEYFLITTNQEYIGYYYKLSTSKKYTGRNPNSGEGIELISSPISTLNLNKEFKENTIGTTKNLFDVKVNSKHYNNNVTNIYPKSDEFQERTFPSPYTYKITPTDIKIGEYRRYFAKKNNELIYIEISKKTYDKYEANDSEVASDLYEVLFFPWSIGYLSSSTNKNIVSIVERNNKWYGFTSYFQGKF